MPPVEEWETFPFEGEMRPRELLAPITREPPRLGAGGFDCVRCEGPDEDYLWTTDRWRLRELGPTGLPVVLMLEPRGHLAEPGDLPEQLAAELGVLLARVERAVRSVPGVGRVHVCRWGDGGEHLNWWFLARPERTPAALRGRLGRRPAATPPGRFGAKTSPSLSRRSIGLRIRIGKD
jgi:diadenosine tetraphosphate (Ap4A) HIT family hydrolase